MKQYQFSLKDECMKELPSMEEPKTFTAPVSFWTNTQLDVYNGNLHEYKKHLASLQSIPVPINHLSFFIDGKVYNEDELEICKYQGETFAVSIPKQKVDDTEIFKDDLKVSMDRYLRDYGSSDKIINDAIDYILPELQKHYTITRK